MFLKDADAEIAYRVDWSAAIAADEAISASGWSVYPVEAGGLDVLRSSLDGAEALVWLGGGVPGHVYRVGNRVTFADGAVDERSLAIRVEER